MTRNLSEEQLGQLRDLCRSLTAPAATESDQA
jgi:hypothetical protein